MTSPLVKLVREWLQEADALREMARDHNDVAFDLRADDIKARAGLLAEAIREQAEAWRLWAGNHYESDDGWDLGAAYGYRNCADELAKGLDDELLEEWGDD